MAEGPMMVGETVEERQRAREPVAGRVRLRILCACGPPIATVRRNTLIANDERYDVGSMSWASAWCTRCWNEYEFSPEKVRAALTDGGGKIGATEVARRVGRVRADRVE